MRSTVTLSLVMLMVALCGGCGSQDKQDGARGSSIDSAVKPMAIQIILGSTRAGRSSEKFAKALKAVADKRSDVKVELVDLRDYSLPFLDGDVAPAKRTEIVDPVIKKWSDKVQEAQGFILLVPEYNAGYPGVLKNALDSLYPEWKDRKVAFVGYSGGPSGGASALAQLRQVTDKLSMLHVAQDIKIPASWKALDEQGNFVNKAVEAEFNSILDRMVKK